MEPVQLFLRTMVIFAVIGAMVAATVRSHHPHDRFGAANVVTTVRAAIVAMIVALIGERAGPAIAVSVVAASLVVVALDGVDGWLARRSGLASAFGARYDMEIDALLILALSVLAWRHDKAGAWVMASGLLRYAFVAAAWPWPWLSRPLPPSRRRQGTCVVQIVALVITMLPSVVPPVSTAIAGAALVLLSWSFLVDTLWLARQ